MLICIPVSRSDAHLIDSMVKAFDKFAPGPNHNLLVVASPDAAEPAGVLLNHIQKFFTNSQLEIFPANNSHDWPRACNFYFQQACFAVSKYISRKQGWLWMELDSVPMTQNWLTILEQEYYGDSKTAHLQNRMPYRFMGTTEQTLQSYGGEARDGGNHMAAVGVYPGDFFECPVLKGVATVGIHFSANLKWYPLKSFNNTPLIQNNRETNNYRVEGEDIVCDSISRNAWDVHWNNPVSEKAILLHGCKDGSLIDLLAEDRKVEIVQRAEIPVVPNVGKKFFEHVSPFETAQLPHAQPSLNQAPVPSNIIPDTTPLLHEKLPAPVVQTFGSHISSSANKPKSQFDESGMPVGVPSLVLAIPAPVLPDSITPIVSDEQTPQATQQQEKAVPRRGRKGKRTKITPEERQRRSDRMKDFHAQRKASKELAAC